MCSASNVHLLMLWQPVCPLGKKMYYPTSRRGIPSKKKGTMRCSSQTFAAPCFDTTERGTSRHYEHDVSRSPDKILMQKRFAVFFWNAVHNILSFNFSTFFPKFPPAVPLSAVVSFKPENYLPVCRNEINVSVLTESRMPIGPSIPAEWVGHLRHWPYLFAQPPRHE